ncbi:MAG: hypothetical protein V2I33_24320 [Kangiellaceae bacterium]|jgi:hypothetical protein|nr:hypothetical protein [Kangiellaceae bacterium]
MLSKIRAKVGSMREFLTITDHALIPILLAIIKEPVEQQICVKALRISSIIIESTGLGLSLVLPICQLAETGTQEW